MAIARQTRQLSDSVGASRLAQSSKDETDKYEQRVEVGTEILKSTFKKLGGQRV